MMYKAIIKNKLTGEIIFKSRKTAFRLDADLKLLQKLAEIKNKTMIETDIIETDI